MVRLPWATVNFGASCWFNDHCVPFDALIAVNGTAAASANINDMPIFFIMVICKINESDTIKQEISTLAWLVNFF